MNVMPQDRLEERLKEVKARLMEMEEVAGVGIGEYQGSPCVMIMLKEDDKQVYAKIESLMGDIPYRIQVSGKFRSLGVSDI